ncbi:sensor histidine kinase [Spongiimicrobium salis]|uniref:sensor histidine kinase n=1 Tax=Spongiimicrobium salis TaxID=1667022 RepID=UPI00374CED5A
MISFLKRHYPRVIAFVIIVISLWGMLIFKQLGEFEHSYEYDNYFSIFQLLFTVTIGYLIISWLFRLWKQYRQLKQEKSKAELALLKSKIDPHFFFNTLNNLYGLAVEKSDDTPKMILKLSEIMRYTIYEGARETVSLQEEISYLEQYIEIHKIRYKKSVRIHFDKDIDISETQIPPLLFIMLLENAFKHGVDSLTQDAYIHLQLKAKNKNVSFTIENNYDASKKEQEGIGLENLKYRLQLLYPRRHQLEFHSDASVFKVQLIIQTK